MGGENGRIEVGLLNVQGLTDVKAYEIGKLMEESQGEAILVGVVETHERYERIEFAEGINRIRVMREGEDKRGGGLMLLSREKDDVMVEGVESGCGDVLVAEVKVRGGVWYVILVYVDTVDMERNAGIYGKLNDIMRGLPENCMRVVMGDFNGHVGFLGPQELNRKGEMMLDFAGEWGLAVLNADDRCEGEITRVQGQVRSVIDFLLVDERMYERFECMKIDEDKEVFDLSDHCYMLAGFRGYKEGRGLVEVGQEREFYKVDCVEMMGEFVKGMEERFRNEEEMKVWNMEGAIKEVADVCLKRSFKVREKRHKQMDQPWMTNEIKREIGIRRELNRRKRGLQGEEYRRVWGYYKVQKERVRVMVRDAKVGYEREMAKQIKGSRGNVNMWKMVDKLRGKVGKDNRVGLYDEEGEKIEEDREAEAMIQGWVGIYRGEDNRIGEVWNGEVKQVYEEAREAGLVERREYRGAQMGIPRIDRVGGVRWWMEDVLFQEGDLERRLNKLKNGKAPGPDGVKGEMYKEMGRSKVCLKGMTGVYNGVLEDGEIGDGWKRSRTVMVPKVRKPKVEQHRPIALMNVGCKIFMGLVKDKMVGQKMSDGRVNDLQSGFTEGRRMQENLFVLSSCVEECYRRKRELVVVAVDFRKAFDSVSRRELVESLKYFKCDPRVIDVVARVYQGDETSILREGRVMGDVEVRNGIRQGCTVSPHMFVMLVGRIIEKVMQSGMGYVCGGVRVPVLFYADDGLLLARSRGEAGEMVELLERTAGEVGLRVNREKSVCMIFNAVAQEVGEIGGMRMVEEMRYLGVEVRARRDCFAGNRQKKLREAERMANLAYSVVARACDRVIIGKAYWKGVVLPSVLSSGQVMVWGKREIDKLQRIENGVWRSVFGAPGHTPVAVLQGEVGCSSVEARDMKEKLKFVRYLMGCESGVVRRIFEGMIHGENGGRWMKLVGRYVEELGLSLERVGEMRDKDVVDAVNVWEQSRWRGELESRSTLDYYRQGKSEIREERYDNGWGSRLVFMVRSNTLRLGWRRRFTGGETVCGVCGEGEESLEHFLVDCREMMEVRERYGVGTVGEAMGFGGVDLGRCGEFLVDMWQLRGRSVGVGDGGLVDGVTALH